MLHDEPRACSLVLLEPFKGLFSLQLMTSTQNLGLSLTQAEEANTQSLKIARLQKSALFYLIRFLFHHFHCLVLNHELQVEGA